MAKLHLLGAIDLDLGNARSGEPVLKQPKHVAILAYLALATPRGYHRRDTLLSLFWPALDDSHARGALNQALYRLRQGLGDDLLTTRGAEEVGLNWDRWWVDAVELRAAQAAQRYEDVLKLYQGELLRGFYANASADFEQWLDGERAAARTGASNAALLLADRAIAAADDGAAIEWLRNALIIQPYDETVLQKLLDLLQRTGQLEAALAEYDRFGARLAADLEIELSPRTAEMARRIRDQAAVVQSSSPTQITQTQLPTPQARSKKMRWSRAGGLTAAALVLTLIGAFVLRRAPAGSTAEMKNIVISDFVNRTSDPQLAAGIYEALSIDLTQSNSIKVASEAYVGVSLKRMGQDTTTALTEELAREVAVRAGFKAVLRGEVAAIGSAYVITAQLITPDSGRVLLSMREEAAAPQDVIAAVDRLSERLRKHMGESLRGAHVDEPLEAVTTSSLDALKLYSTGERAVRRASWSRNGGLFGRQADEVISLFEQAIARDSMFASAYRSLAVFLYWRFNQQARVNELLTRAYQLRNRLTERERLLTEGTYYSFVTHENTRAIASFQQLLERDPDDNRAVQHLAVLYFRRRDFTRAVAMNERDWKMRGGDPPPFYAFSLLGAGESARVDSLVEGVMMHDHSGGWWHRFAIRLQAARGNFQAADTLVTLMQRLAATGGPRLMSDADQLAGLIKIWRGAYDDGSALLRASQRARGPVIALMSESTLARADVFVLHDAAQARRRLDAALAKNPLESIPDVDRPYLELAEAYAYAGDAKRAALLLRAFRAALPPGVIIEPPHVKAYTVDALVHAAEGNIPRAREIIAEGERDLGCWETVRELYLARAVVEEQSGNPDRAARAWERLTGPQSCQLGVVSLDVQALTQAHAHERLAQLYNARGETELAAVQYARFLKLWPKPDAVLQTRVRTAERRIGQLRN